MTFDHKQFRFDMIEKRIMELDTTMQIASEQIGKVSHNIHKN